MERGNSKHGPRLDDEMEHEVRGMLQGGVDTRVEEWRDPEPAGEDQPNPTRVPVGYERTGVPAGMTPEEVEQRSRIGRYIPLSALPGDRDDLLAAAEENDAPQDVIDRLAALPAERVFETINQVWAALGGHNEERRA
ncbi:DUF2795 domain-containing protein [Planosporangium sp. 12N6]|uniref:DUF2795 domain-containing protein n=1 Tax=Planosporangium spinosum TaxID=3402278 RepID=UPI003CF55FAE